MAPRPRADDDSPRSKRALSARQVRALERIAAALERLAEDDDADDAVPATADAPTEAPRLTESQFGELLRSWSDCFGFGRKTAREAIDFARRVSKRHPTFWRAITRLGWACDEDAAAVLESELLAWEEREVAGEQLVMLRAGMCRKSKTRARAYLWSAQLGPTALAALDKADGKPPKRRRPRDPSVAATPPCSARCADGDCKEHGNTRAQFGGGAR